jgi:hypothetical protein
MGYARLDYRKETSRGREAYELVYQRKDGEAENRTLATYIGGPDEAIVIRFIATPADFENLQGLFARAVDSFQWDSE